MTRATAPETLDSWKRKKDAMYAILLVILIILSVHLIDAAVKDSNFQAYISYGVIVSIMILQLAELNNYQFVAFIREPKLAILSFIILAACLAPFLSISITTSI